VANKTKGGASAAPEKIGLHNLTPAPGSHRARKRLGRGPGSGTGKTSWTFSYTAGSGDGVQTVTAAASPNVNTNDKCTGTTSTRTASYTLDNTGPVVSATVTPAPNAAGWNNTNATVTWSASDAGSGVAVTAVGAPGADPTLNV